MSVPFSIISSDMSASAYLRALAFSVGIWIGLFMIFILVIDPYGVSPLHLSWSRINAIKIKRLHIDRSLKPYEVWRYQPRTVFLGSSRVEHSIDPSMLEGTRFAPAYNAAVPSGSAETSLDLLEQYVRLDMHLRTVIVELNLSDFLFELIAGEAKTRSEFIWNSLGLFASHDAIWAAIVTLDYNALSGTPSIEIKPGGYFYRPSGLEAQSGFDPFADFIWSGDDPTKLTLNRRSLDAVRKMVEVARRHELELIFLAAPNHAYFDYYYESVGAWGIIREALAEMTQLGTVYSFSQPNAWVYERVSAKMAYWNDALHPSLRMGHGMQVALAGLSVAGLPDNFIERLRPERVASHVESRRQAVQQWAKANPAFVERFEEARQKWLASKGSVAGRSN
jgi:hypothetical protein